MASLEKAAEAKPESKAPTYEVLEEDDEFEVRESTNFEWRSYRASAH